MAGLSEFELIKRYFSPLSASDNGAVLLGSGDDCGVISPPHGKDLCFSIDTLVEGVHFPPDAPPFELAYRALAVAMSDLAAMGASPFFFTLALTLPKTDPEWLELFAGGLKTLADKYQFPLLGGDTTRGPLSISIQVHGLLNKPALQRSGAKEGDVIAVSGTLGDAGAALDLLPRFHEGLSPRDTYLLSRYYQPSPRIELGESMLSYASACIDISDGLLAEAAHISEKSSVSVEIDSSLIPLSCQLIDFKGKDKAKVLALSAGDDYELLFTMPESGWHAFTASIPAGLVHRIGCIKAGSGVYLDGCNTDQLKKGFQHFD
tara:strand:- start:746 stop:1702 length:957 start_codon:yes stop_codon:yes gene_type:complete